MKISLIVAMASNRAIGLNGRMPWHLSADLKHFKQVTMGSPVLMGRKTFEAIGRPLPGRENIIISRNDSFQAEGCKVFNALEQALQYTGHSQQVFIIGGATLYQAMLAQADYLYLTLIDREFAGDTFFPEIGDNWQEIEREEIKNDQAVDFTYSFLKMANLNKTDLRQ
jgi:dihydrofolate reductase